MKNFTDMLKQAQAMQAKLADVQESLTELRVSGQSGGGLVTVEVDGKSAVKGVKIDPSLLKEDESEILEDLIVAAYADAQAKAEQAAQEKMQDVTQGLNLPPGMKLPF